MRVQVATVLTRREVPTYADQVTTKCCSSWEVQTHAVHTHRMLAKELSSITCCSNKDRRDVQVSTMSLLLNPKNKQSGIQQSHIVLWPQVFYSH
jgi:hypothetical protein